MRMIFRAFAIWTVATFGLLAYGMTWLALLARPGAEQRAARRAHVKGVILRRCLSALGATFVKLVPPPGSAFLVFRRDRLRGQGALPKEGP